MQTSKRRNWDKTLRSFIWNLLYFFGQTKSVCRFFSWWFYPKLSATFQATFSLPPWRINRLFRRNKLLRIWKLISSAFHHLQRIRIKNNGRFEQIRMVSFSTKTYIAPHETREDWILEMGNILSPNIFSSFGFFDPFFIEQFKWRKAESVQTFGNNLPKKEYGVYSKTAPTSF